MNGNICILKCITDIQNHGSESMHICDSNVDSEWVSMCQWTVGLIKINTFNLRTPISQWLATNSHASEDSPSLILRAMSEWRNCVPSRRDLIGMGTERRLTFLFLSYFTNKTSFHHCIWGHYKPSPILFGVGDLFEIQISRCETTGLTWSNLDQISSRSVLW